MQPLHESNVTFPFRARFVSSGAVNTATREVWFVLHGYGQLAPYFIRKFEPVFSPHRCIVAPEGLHRFYHEPVQQRAAGAPGRVGASWMTREARLTDIENYLACLAAIYRAVIPSGFGGSVSILGFSQGAATACRWALAQPDVFERLILWAGIFPEDIDFDLGHTILANKKTVMVYGTDDPFLTRERLALSENLVAKLQINPEVFTYAGGHDIDVSALKKIAG
jgi:predicted esterase